MTKVRHVLFSRTQLGWKWKCEITFTMTTDRQFTDEEITVEAGCRGHSLWALFKAWWTARGEMKLFVQIHKSIPGVRESKGWMP